MDSQDPLTPWALDFRHSIAVIGDEAAYTQPNNAPGSRSEGTLANPRSLTPGQPATFQRHSFVGLPQEYLAEGQQYGQPLHRGRPSSTIDYQPNRTMPDAFRAPDTLVRRRPVPSMPTVMSNNNACSRPDASMPTAPPGTVIPQRPVLSMPVTTSRVPLATKLFGEPPFYHKKAMPSTAQHPAAALDLRTGPASDVPHASLAQIAVNNARTMSLRRFLHWVISQPEIHTLQSINHAQAKDTEKSTTRAIHVLRNLVVLEEMYRPGRVMLPTQELYHIVQVIHTELEHMRRLTEDTVEQIHGNSRSMDATEFVTWLSYHFTVCERRFKIPKASFLYDPDSLTCQQHLVDKALEFYRQPDILHDRTLTNALIDIIVRALMGYYNEAYRSNGKYKPLAQIRAERKAARENSAKSSPGADRLLFQHDAPR